MACKCEGKTYHIGMGCCKAVVANPNIYYTKSEIDEKLSGITTEGISEEEAQELIDESLINYYTSDEVDSMVNEKWEMRYTNVPFTGSINTIIESHSMSELIDEWNNGNPPIIYMTDERGDKFYFFPSALFFNDLDVTSYTATYIGNYSVSLVTSCALNEGSDGTIIATLQLHILPTYSDIPSLNGYATEQWVQSQGYLTQHQSLSGYATEQWVEDKGYLTEHQPIKTINNISLIGEGNIEIGTGGTIDLSDYYKKEETDALLNEKLDVSAYTPTDLSNYYTKSETDAKLDLKANSVVANSTSQIYYPTTKAVYDEYQRKPDVVYTGNTIVGQSGNVFSAPVWNGINADLSVYKRLKVYLSVSKHSVGLSSDNITSPNIVEVVMSDDYKISDMNGYYAGSNVVTCINNDNRLFAATVLVNNNQIALKTVSLYGTSSTNITNSHIYLIEGYYD